MGGGWGGGGVGGKGVNNVHSGLCENGELKNTFNRKLLWSYFITIKIPWSGSQFHSVKQWQSTCVYLGQSQRREIIRWTNRNSSRCRDCNASAGKHPRATSNDWFLFHSWLVMKEARDFQPMKSSAKLDKFTLHAQLPKLYSSRYSTTFYKTTNHQMSVQ